VPPAHKRPLKTLERVISKAGLGSRTEARRWIRQGRVQVNGTVVENADAWIDLERDRVRFDGKPLQSRERVYILLYKPTGYITTYKDPEGRRTVYDLLTVLGDELLQRLRDGVELNDGPTRPATVTRVRDSAKYTHFEITLTEGRNRQVRRMVEAVGAKVLKLVRVQIGPLRIGPLQIGRWRHLTRGEVESLLGRVRRSTPERPTSRSRGGPRQR
jgi:16S rRNA U516 pseudouridylate synthase RsuA-like enzyme